MLNLCLLQTSKKFHIVSFFRQSIDGFRVVGPVALGDHEQHLWQQ